MPKLKVAKYLYLTIIVVLVFTGFYSVNSYNRVFRSNVNDGSRYLYIPTGSDFTDIIEILKRDSLLINIDSFIWLAEKKNYTEQVHPGRYKIEKGANNNSLIDILRSGYQTPVRVVFNSVRTREQLASKISKQIEADSISLINLFYKDSIYNLYNLNLETFTCIFLPNTYEFWWNTSAEKFIDRMHKEYEKFWNSERLQKAQKLKLTEEEVITLASIVDEETYFNDEMPKIAGVYINRLRKRMHLQADPTLKFALGDFMIKRVLNVHKQLNSPYNTYKFYGLPPGPISIPSISAIDAVLNYEEHSYLYFCAKPDFSGYHNFAKSLAQHNINARDYQRALNKEKIWR